MHNKFYVVFRMIYCAYNFGLIHEVTLALMSAHELGDER